jgi:hypothetical protein
MRPGYCRCDRPVLNPRRPDFCRRCGVRHDPQAQSNVSTIGEFFAHLSDLPGVGAAALHHAQVREQAGREEFGLSYLGRDNDAEACEEAADGIIYAHLSALNDRRAGIQDIDPDLLDAAHHFALAHAALERRSR